MLTALAHCEAAFVRAILGDRVAQDLADAILDDGIAPAARLQIYRNHFFVTLSDVLAAAFPVVRRLVDPRFFAYASRQFIAEHPPASPCLFEYGAALPDFLASFPPCAHLPYLADVARLEWLMQKVQFADAPPALPMAALGAVAAADMPQIVFGLHPTFAWIESRWPIDAIWRVNQPEVADPALNIAETQTCLEVRREPSGASFRALDPAHFAFRKHLGEGRALAAAVNAALAIDPLFDLAQAIGELFAGGLPYSIGFASETEKELDTCNQR